MEDAEAARILASSAGACAMASFLLPSLFGAFVAFALSSAWLRGRNARARPDA